MRHRTPREPNETDDGRRIHIYVDETAFFDADGQQCYGTGALVVDRPIDRSVITEALEALQQDPDIHLAATSQIDAETLRRGFFHASEDSKNAHSHLVRAINRTFRGQFHYSLGGSDDRGEAAAFRRHAIGNLMVSIKSNEPVRVCFEQRSGFGREAAARWVSYMYEGLDWQAFDLPEWPAFYSRVHVEVRGKSEPGLQLADFLLWACVQAVYRPDSRKAVWHDRIESAWWQKPTAGQDEQFGKIVMLHNEGAASDHANSRSRYPKDVVSGQLDRNEELNLYCTAERVVHWAATTELPGHARHLRAMAQAVWAKVKRSGEDVSVEQIMGVASVYLRLFDTVPIYVDENISAFQWLYMVKRFCAVLLRLDQTASVSALDALRDARRGVYLNERHCLLWPPN